MSEEKNLLEVSHLKQYFPVHQGFKTIPLKAVDDISFAIKPGETLGLVGESGCGKTTVGRTLLRLYQPTAGRIVFDGKVLFDSGEQYDENGRLIVDANGRPVLGKRVDVDMLPYRRQMQMVFQDPYSSLNPRMTVEDIIGEPLDVHKLYANKKERREKILNLMELVGLNAEHAMRYAHEFSGGQRQRIGIARALAVNPKFIVCDEPVSALDVSIQAQVVNMFEELQDKLGVAYLFIAHDLLVVHHISDRIAVMYLGKMMEIADADELNGNPMHPYTLSLLSAVPIPDPETARHSKRIVLEGDVPSPLKMPTGCPFDGKVLFDSGEQYDENGRLIVDANGRPVLGKRVDVDMLPYRRQMQMVFQDPYSSLNPRMTVEDIIGEPLDVHKLYANKKERREKILNLMELVGLNAEHAMRYAHEFSGGQRQRIGIARALAVNPKFIVCDEPVSALDVSIQAQVVNMFEELQDKLGVAYLFIAHDLLVVHHISDRIAVMYLGKMMEIADADELNGNPMHPYTLSLLSAVPIPDPETARHSKRIVLEGDVPSPLKMPTGCPFRTRCKYATEQCAKEMPPLSDRGSGHFVACWNK